MKLHTITKKQDGWYTPPYAITPLLKYVKDKYFIVWCPFDTEDSHFVKVLRGAGFYVIATHIDYNQDFFIYEPENYDVIISNPPYSLKNEVFERLFNLKKPFAMLVGIVGIFESKRRYNLFRNNDFEILYFDKRINFFRDFIEQKPSASPPFSSSYIYSGILPKQIIFEEITR